VRSDAEAAVAKIKEVTGKVDIVIANAGINTSYQPLEELSLEAMREHFEVRLALVESYLPC
jgi:NAD(P)-dependent dehydrogenase (short-subunit alcohol dehydrogenase family)